MIPDMVTTAPLAIPPCVTIPARLKDGGWELIEDTPGTWIATHPRYGATAPTIFSGHRPDLAQKYMVEKIAQLMPPDEGLTLTSISHRLTSINEEVGIMERMVSDLHKVIARLEPHRCIGTIRYRSAASGTHFVYTDHTAGAICPYCGTHPEGKRYRKYHGEDETATAENAKEAVSDQQEYLAACAERDALESKLQRIKRLIWQLETATK